MTTSGNRVARRSLVFFVLLSLAFVGYVPRLAAQTAPAGCWPNGSTYECTSYLLQPYIYERISCGTTPDRTTEGPAFADWVAQHNYCGLTTTRNGWITAARSVQFCGVVSTYPQTGGSPFQLRNVSNYTARYWKSCSNPTLVTKSWDAVFRKRSYFCPFGWSGYSLSYCRRPINAYDQGKRLGKSCPTCGNPINPGAGNKYQEETDYAAAGPSPLVMRRYYNSAMQPVTGTFHSASNVSSGSTELSLGDYARLGATEENPRYMSMGLDSIGGHWRHHYQRSVHYESGGPLRSALVYRADGKVYSFLEHNGVFTAPRDVADRLTRLADGTFEYRVVDNDSLERYSAAGFLQSITYRTGVVHTVAYDTCSRAATVTDSFGRALTFHYADDCALVGRTIRITSVGLPSGETLQYSYDDDGDLVGVTYADLTQRRYQYSDPYGRYLTGVIDEMSQPFATYGYDSLWRASSSQHAGGVDAVNVVYTKSGDNWNITTATMTDARGAVSKYFYVQNNGVNRISQHQKPGPSGTGTTNAYWSYDSFGNIVTYTDFNGWRTSFVYDTKRNLETSRTEGLTGNGATTPRTRTITTQWHATYRLPTLITEAGRTSSFGYDSSGNLLSRTITDTVTGASRTWAWTYDSLGRVLTADGPRTDVNDITTYTYYTCTTGGACGQLETVTDPLGHVTTYQAYDAHGQPLEIIDPNGVWTTLTYDARQRLTSRTVGGETTAYSYWPTGLLKRVSRPDGSYLEYTYDAAHRLTGIADGEGNRIVYTLDSMSNRTKEERLDPSNALSYAQSRAYNALNQLKQVIGAANTTAVTTTLGYDNNGNPTTTSAPLGRNITNAYDELNRLKQTTDAANGVTRYGYNALDQLISVTDPRNLVTSYQMNAFGDVTQLTSPDTGVTRYEYDSAGNRMHQTDARNKATNSSYDAGNRITSIVYDDQILGFGYDVGANGKGRLTSLTDGSGSTTWAYTPQGRVSTRSQVMGVMTRSVGYGYDAGGRLQSLTLPSGAIVSYGYTEGRITSVAVNGSPVVTGVLYEPFGPTRGWTWGNGMYAVRGYTTDGNIAQIDSNGLKTYSYDDAFRIIGITDTVTPGQSWTYGYDLLDRLASAARTGQTQGWTYDANGNRLTETGNSPSTFTVSTTSNRLSTVSGTLSRSYGYDAAGNTTSDGGRTFTYNDAGRMTTYVKDGVTTTLTYNGLGQRVTKSNVSGTHYFVYDESGHLLGEYDASGALFQETVWMGDIPIAALWPDGSGGVTVTYIHTDHLNTPREITRTTDHVVLWRWRSDPFGTDMSEEDVDGDSVDLRYYLRFPGQFFDFSSGLHYNYFRDYDPMTGRYVESDPIGLDGGTNTYAYSLSSPIRFQDPQGLACGTGWNDPIVPDSFAGGAVDFTGPCVNHDACYGTCGSSQARCDYALERDMKSVCMQAYRSGRIHLLPGCFQRAVTYRLALRLVGFIAHGKAQKQACAGCQGDTN